MPKQTKFTEEQIRQIKQMAQVKLPTIQMASILGMSHDTFERRMKKDPAARASLEKARDAGSLKLRATLYNMAMGTPADPLQGRLAVPPDFQAAKFWAQTQEGFKTADRLEVTGADGKPVQTEDVTPEERKAKVASLAAKLKIIEDV